MTVLTRSMTRKLQDGERNIEIALKNCMNSCNSHMKRATDLDENSTVAASDAASILGTNPYESAFEVLKRKCGYGKKQFYGNSKAMQHGVNYEANALKLFSNKYNVELKSIGNIRHKEHNFLSGRPDSTYEVEDDNGNVSTIPVEV